jgi:hypothetical protein
LVTAGIFVGANPAVGLSCIEAEPFNMEAAIAEADAAAVGTVTSVTLNAGNNVEQLVVVVEVTEVFKGTVPAVLRLDRPTSVWGPYYDEGTELALLVSDGVVDDGQNSLCGPFYSADDMREAGGDPSAPVPELQPPGPEPVPPPAHWGILDLLWALVSMLGMLLGR